MKKIGIGLLGLGTVGQGVANIICDSYDRHPLVEELELASTPASTPVKTASSRA